MNLKNKGIKIFGLNYKDDKEKAIRWLDQFGNPYWKTIYDPRGNFGLEIGVSGAPETYLIDKENKIIQKHIGIVNENIWKNKFIKLIK
jgi:cytochrome c biogenesis protein CcmG/thiol:disulfide interchange protein DsbE